MKKLLTIVGWTLGVMFIIVAGLLIYVQTVSGVSEPAPVTTEGLSIPVQHADSNLTTFNGSWLRKSESGFFEMYVKGKPFERGVAIGKLSQELIQYQEEVFNQQIHQLVPSGFYLGVLKYFVGWFNRDLDENVGEEFRQEIYGVSRAASHQFDDIAPPYQRILNYHAAHDIGHALQNMSLVGCTSFATWGDKSEDSTLIIGRNFDFYVGDDFAKNKIIAFYDPDQGYRFMMITFGGMTGVLSGMNDQGLTVTINAAKSDIPSASATPVSLVAREILQYASTINEAYDIAKKRKMFVAESFLIGSAKDKHAAIIEKSPDDTDLYVEHDGDIICTNHFQGNILGHTELNRTHIATSASRNRYERVSELLEENKKNSVVKTAVILRDRAGLKGMQIGLGNEKSINQLIAHHGIIFQPEERLVWISTAPWQLGKFVCYDLDNVFDLEMKGDHEIYEGDLALPADPFLLTHEFRKIVKFNKYRFPFNPRHDLNPDSLIAWNPDSYLAYMLSGDHYLAKKDFYHAEMMYERALKKVIATSQEEEYITENLNRCKRALAN